MNQEYKHSEIIEAYLRNDLSVEQKADFEELVRQDPLLYNEFMLQKDVVSGLQQHRKSQLKARLNQVDVSNPVQLGGIGVLGLWLAGASLIGLLGWFAYSNINAEQPNIALVVIEQPATQPTADVPLTQDTNAAAAAGNPRHQPICGRNYAAVAGQRCGIHPARNTRRRSGL
jgi:hypothetical protein